MSTSSPSHIVSPAQQRKRAATAAFIGTTVEYYDFLLYTVASALVFPKVFFPNLAPGVGVVASFGTFAAGYFAKPIGAVFFGHFGDRIGRKMMLMITMVLMGIASVGIGLIPGHASIGLAAPVLLVAARMLQGFANGGEWGGAVLVATEAAPDRKGLFGGFTQAGGPAGGLLSTGFMTLMQGTLSHDAFMSWGWRLPFWCSAVLVAFGLGIRIRLGESEAFQQVVATKTIVRVPLKEVLTKYPRSGIVGTMVTIGGQATTGLVSTYMIAYAVGIGYDASVTLKTKIFMNIGNFIGVLFFAWLSDRVGQHRLIGTGAILLMVSSFFLFHFLNSLQPLVYGAAMVTMYTLVQPLMHGPTAGLISQLFPANVRYSGTAISFQVGSVLGAGLAPLIASSLLALAGGGMNTKYLTVFMIVAGVIGWAGALASRSIIRRPPTVAPSEPAPATVAAA